MKINLHRCLNISTLIVWSVFLASIAVSQPKLSVVGGLEPDFGDVPNFTSTKHRVILKNTGTDTLILSEIGTSCGCTATLLSNDHIPPNDSANLDVTFDAERFAGQRVTKRISMVTNDETQTAVAINFKVNVVNIVDLSPKYFYIRTTENAPTTGALTITNTSDRTIHISNVRSNQEIFVPSINIQTLSPGDSATISVTFTPQRRGTLNGNIELTIDHPLAKQVNIRCFGFVTSATADKKH
jgi:hypothetical protein